MDVVQQMAPAEATVAQMARAEQARITVGHFAGPAEAVSAARTGLTTPWRSARRRQQKPSGNLEAVCGLSVAGLAAFMCAPAHQPSRGQLTHRPLVRMGRREMDHYERYLLALHKELSGQGVRSVLHTQGIRPRLRIYGTEDLPGCGFDNNVIAAALAGQWMFWWPWAEPIGPASQLTHTATAIIEGLGLTAESPTTPSVQAALPPGVPSLAALRQSRQARGGISSPHRAATSSYPPRSPDGMDPAS